MKFFERKVLKDLKDFQQLSTDDKRKYLTIFKHTHLAQWLSEYFIIPRPSVPIFNLLICLASLVLLCFVKSDIIQFIVFILTLPCPITFIILAANVNYKLERQKINSIKVQEWVIEKIQNFWLLDLRAISTKDWYHIRKTNRELYKQLRSEESNHRCYVFSYRLAKALNNPKNKIMWLCVSDFENSKYGHACIERNGFIYDTNTRRTYPKRQYLEAFKAEIFKEYSLKDYRVKDFLKLDWEEFGKWCQEHNAIR